MLLLIFADGYQIGLIKQNVRRHQHRIVKYPNSNVLALARLIFELSHAFKFGHARDAVKHPGQFRMFSNIRLNEDGRDCRINSDCNVDARQLASFLGQKLRVLPRGDRVQVDDAKKALILMLQPHPVAQRAEVIAQMDVAGRLRAAKNSFHGLLPMNTSPHASGITTLKMTTSTPVKTAMNNRINPNRSRVSIPDSKLGGSMLASTLLPSSGGIGRRLNTPSATLRIKKTISNSMAPFAIVEPAFTRARLSSMTPVEYSTLIMIPATNAMMKLLIAPAADTQKLATRLLRHLSGLTGVGLAQPISGAPVKKAIAGKSKVPIGSTCETGFRLMRPCKRARSSPNLFDIQAWADS